MGRDTISPPLVTGIEGEIAELYQRDGSAILRYAWTLAGDKETAHDALQEAFFRFFLCRSAGQEIRSAKGWLFRVAHNYVLDQRKARARNEIAIDSIANMPSPLPQVDSDSISDLLQRLAGIGLTAREIECVRLRAEDLRYEEIAMVLGLQSGTVGSLLARAHDKIRKALAEPGRKESFRLSPATQNRYAS
jgi:RNA polymerase sigma factor (sigma-70 family)